MAFFDDLNAVLAIVDKANQSADVEINFEHLIHIAFDISVNAFNAMEKGEVVKPYADGIRDGMDAMLIALVQDTLEVDKDIAVQIVFEATKKCMEEHKGMHEKLDES